MGGILKLIANLFKLLFGVDEAKKIKKAARKEVKREKKSGGIDSVRKSTSTWFTRNK